MEREQGGSDLNAREVLAEIVNYRNKLQQGDLKRRSRISKYASFFIWLLGIIVVIVTYFIGAGQIVIPEKYILTYLLVWVISLFLMLAALYQEYVRDDEFNIFLKDPTLSILNASHRPLQEEICLFAKLDEFPMQALVQTRNYLRRKKTLMGSLSGMLVGVLTKVGLLPALLAVSLVALKIYSEIGLSPFSLVGFILVGTYFLCFRLIEASVKFDEYQSLLTDYIESRPTKD